MRKKQFDLHLHTYYSDGKDSPRKIFQLAKNAGLRLISITDHNSIGHVREEEALARKFRINYLPGVELSCKYEGRHIHLAGYGFNPNSGVLATTLQKIQRGRRKGILQVVSKLRKSGFHITSPEILGLKAEYYGLAHIIGLLMKKRNDRRRILSEVGSTDIFAIINHYFSAASDAYVPERYLPAVSAIKLIRRAGGIVALAHPGAHLRYQDDRLVAQLKKAGLECLEGFTPKHNWDQVVHYEMLAKKLNLIITAGSNFHEDFHQNDIPIVTPIGFMKTPGRIFDKFNSYARRKLGFRLQY